ncbi:hypothetical protein ACLOJK_030895 [Asimina triloba]
MEIFAENPRSFRMDRKSPEASKLKASVSEKLFEFLGSYSDDVLAPREEKQCMLSTFSTKPTFSNTVDTSEHYQHCYPGHTALTEQNIEGVLGYTSQNEISGKRTGNSKVAMKHGSSRDRCFDGISAGGEQCLHFEDQYKKVDREKPSVLGPWSNFSHLHIIEQIVNGSDSDSPLLLHSSKMRNMQSAYTESSHLKHVSMTNAATGRSSSAADAAFHLDTRRRGNVWDRLGRPRDENNVSTADRIYPYDIDVTRRKKLEHDRESHETQRLRLLVPDGGNTRKVVTKVAVLDNNSGELVSNEHSNEFARPDHGANTVRKLGDACIFRRKRQHCEINAANSLSDSGDRHQQDKILLQGLQSSQSVKHGRSQELNGGVASDCRSSDGHFSESACRLPRSPNPALNPAICGNFQGQLERKASPDTGQAPVSINSTLLAKSESLKPAGRWQTSCKPVQDEVLDMKLKLKQIEMEMTKLRSKQADINIDVVKKGFGNAQRWQGCSKKNVVLAFRFHSIIVEPSSCFLLYFAGSAQKHSEEDIESRTIFVTNVHFAATKEALSAHFSKCGAVVKTTLLRDTVTGQPKGSAYVAFASKLSADKAIAISGTSFLSRTLKDWRPFTLMDKHLIDEQHDPATFLVYQVVRKADAPSESCLSTHQIGKPSQPWHQSSPLTRRASLQRPYCGTHLQWRRGDIDSSGSTLASKKQAYKTSEHGIG